MEGIFKEFQKIFKEEGVTAMEPVGKPYDADRHEVLGTVEKEGAEDGEVVDVMQSGFMIQDKVLRTAKVRIAKAKKEA
jgi:molecular chaperone GrpE